jgi:hypothetical protein
MTKRRKVDIDNLPGNNIEGDGRIISGKVRTKKPKSGFASDVRDILNTLYSEVISPNVRTIIGDAVTTAIEMILWGEPSSRDYGRRGTPRDYTRYSRSPARRGRMHRAGTRAGRVARIPELQDIYYDHKEDADLVLVELLERVNEYGWVSVGDLYALSGISATHNDEQYGWFDLSRIRVIHTPDGYMLNLPRPAHR